MNEFEEYDNSDDMELNFVSLNLLCLERIEQILMSMNFSYNEGTKRFEKIFYVNDDFVVLKTFKIEEKSNSIYLLLINEFHNDNDKFIKYVGYIPDTEIDLHILCNLLELNNLNNDDTLDDIAYFNDVLMSFKTKLIMSGYSQYSNNIFLKKLSTYNENLQDTYIIVKIDIENDSLIINENKDTIYNGLIPKSMFEFQTLYQLINFQLI